MKEKNKTQRNIAQAAYFLLKHEYYGSKCKAVSALRKRKDTRQCDPVFLADSLSNAIAIVHRLDDLASSVLKQYSTSFHSQLTEEEFKAGEKSLRQSLLSEFPDSKIEVNYLMAMLWHMSHAR